MENKQDKGFTLVELLIVIVILGILATITVFAVRGITDQGQTASCNSDKKTMQTAVEAYFAQNGGTTIPATAPATPEDTLVTAKLIVAKSGNYDVTSTGGLTYQAAAAGSTNKCIPTGAAAGDLVPA